jgi:serine/threonine protein kinase
MEKSANSGEHAYNISLVKENFIGEGTYSDVYKIYSKDQQEVYAGKFLKISPENMSPEDKLGYERELEILKSIDSPYIIKYVD